MDSIDIRKGWVARSKAWGVGVTHGLLCSSFLGCVVFFVGKGF